MHVLKICQQNTKRLNIPWKWKNILLAVDEAWELLYEKKENISSFNKRTDIAAMLGEEFHRAQCIYLKAAGMELLHLFQAMRIKSTI